MSGKIKFLFLIFASLYTLGRSAGDFAGYDPEIKPEYRDKPGLAVWQRNRAWSNLVIGGGTLLFLLLERFEIAAPVFGVVVIGALFYKANNDKKFTEGEYEEKGGR